MSFGVKATCVLLDVTWNSDWDNANFHEPELQNRNPPQGMVADKSVPELTNSRVPATCACHCSHSI